MRYLEPKLHSFATRRSLDHFGIVLAIHFENNGNEIPFLKFLEKRRILKKLIDRSLYTFPNRTVGFINIRLNFGRHPKFHNRTSVVSLVEWRPNAPIFGFIFANFIGLPRVHLALRAAGIHSHLGILLFQKFSRISLCSTRCFTIF
jgi:hypothetical protein